MLSWQGFKQQAGKLQVTGKRNTSCKVLCTNMLQLWVVAEVKRKVSWLMQRQITNLLAAAKVAEMACRYCHKPKHDPNRTKAEQL